MRLGPECPWALRRLKEDLRDLNGRRLFPDRHADTVTFRLNRDEYDLYKAVTAYINEIHGGMNPHERKRAQENFRTATQVCVATEAAGEGINLQFCRLMINYDLPWNPTRLEQRLGRIHRIGQERDVYAFNFVANESEDGQPIVEGRILDRLLYKLQQMRAVLADRVFDVIGEVLSLNEVNLPEMLREAAFDPRRLDDYLDQIERIDPARLKQYENATGIALARANVDFSGIQQANLEAEERRLMPRYVEEQFVKGSEVIGLRLEVRADGLWRIEHVLADLRSDRLAAVRRLGKPEAAYRKFTFHKEHLDLDQHLDAVLVGPGHPLYAAVDERLNELLQGMSGSVALFVDANATKPYQVHFFELSIRGQNTKGEPQVTHAELVAVREETDGGLGAERFSVIQADYLIDLPAHRARPPQLEGIDASSASDFVKSGYQLDLRSRAVEERRHFVEVCREYLTRNAVMHRTYEGTNAPVRVYWFDDRIEIHNPGGPYGAVTVENFGQPGITDYRNPHIAEAMKVLGFVQRFAVGIATAQAELNKNGNPPIQFTVEATAVLAAVRRKP